MQKVCLEALFELFIRPILAMSNRVTEVGYKFLCALDIVSFNTVTDEYMDVEDL